MNGRVVERNHEGKNYISQLELKNFLLLVVVVVVVTALEIKLRKCLRIYTFDFSQNVDLNQAQTDIFAISMLYHSFAKPDLVFATYILQCCSNLGVREGRKEKVR